MPKSIKFIGSFISYQLGADRTVLLQLYRSLIRSKLDYGSMVYGSARKSYLLELGTVQGPFRKYVAGTVRGPFGKYVAWPFFSVTD